MAILDISRKVPKKIYTFEEVFGGKIGSHCINYNYKNSLSFHTEKASHWLYQWFSHLEIGPGDVRFNARRSILGSIPLEGKIAHHLHSIEYSGQKGSYSVQLLRKSKWPAKFKTKRGKWSLNVSIVAWTTPSHQGNRIPSFDFNPSGEAMAAIDFDGECLVSDVNTHKRRAHVSTREIGILDFQPCACFL